jgi:hypothetical protein
MKNTYNMNSSQISRRMFFAGGIAVGSASLLASTDANATVKLSRASVRYTETSKDGHNCANCKLFAAPNRCLFLEGPTSPDGSCWIWSSKTA